MKIFAVVMLSLQKLYKDKKTVAFLIAFPIFFTFIFGKIMGISGTPGVPLVVTDYDNSVFSQALVSELKANKSLAVSSTGEKEAINLVKEKKNELAVIIPKGFGQNVRNNKKTTIRTVHIPNSNSAVALQEILESNVNQMEANAAAASETVTILKSQNKLASNKVEETWNSVYKEAEKKWSPEPPMTVKYRELSGKDITKSDYNGMTQASLGFTIAFVMFNLTFGAGAILEEKESGTWGRLLSTPTKPAYIFTGFLIAAYIMGWIQVAILILAGKFLFGVNWGANLFGVVILMSAYLFAVMGFGLLLTGFVKTQAQLQAITPIFMSSFAMIGGAYWPLDIMPKFMQTLAKFLPTGQAMQALLDLVARGKGLMDIQQPIYILLLMGLVTFAIGLMRVRFE